MIKLPHLSDFPLAVKLLVTSFLLTLGLEYGVAGLYTQQQFGFSYQSIVGTFSESKKGKEQHMMEMEKHFSDMEKHLREMEAMSPQDNKVAPKDNQFGETEITLDQVQEMPHRVDLKLLLQDGHVHFFSIGAMNLLMGACLLFTRLSDRWKVVLTPLPFAFSVVNYASMFMIKYVADSFAYLILLSGVLMGVSFAFEFFYTLYEIWFVSKKESSHEK